MTESGNNKKYQDYLFIIVLALLAYWPVSFMLFSVKNDAINYFLAMRYNTSEAIQSGHFPLWSPYINLGYPLHGDMQSGTWNPVVLVMSLVRKYDIYWLQLETIITIIISGCSFYKLLSHFQLSRVILLAGSAAYMLNGYITDAGQFLNWLYAAAYLPLVVLYAIRSFEQFSTRDAFLLGVSFSLMLLSAYPADFILLGYLLTAYFLFSVFRYKKDSGLIKSFTRCLKPALIAVVSFALICLPAILSYLPFLASIRRGNGVELDVALSNSFSPVNFISVLTPWPTQRLNWEQYTDPLIRNSYMGLIPLVFLITYFRQKSKKTFVQYFFTGTLIFFLLFSLGKAGGLRVLSYYTLPLLDSFRHPANAKLFVLFAAQLLSFLTLDKYLKEPGSLQPAIKRIVNILLVITGLLLITGLFKTRIFQLAGKLNVTHGRLDLKTIFDAISFYDFLFLNATLAFIILLMLRWTLKKNRLQRWLLPVLCAEMILAAQFMLPLTYFRTSSPQTVQNILNAQPKGYPAPDGFTSIREMSADGMNYFNEIGCLNPFNKKPGRSDYIITPANLSWQLDFWEDTAFREKIIEYPFYYLADTIYQVPDKKDFIRDTLSRKAALANLSLYAKPLIPDNQDALSVIESFGPEHIRFKVNSAGPTFLVLFQNHYPNWAVRINGQKTDIIPTNHAFMGVVVPGGEQVVEFRYEAPGILYMAMGSLLFTLAGLVYFSRKKKNTREQKAD
ncbi:MAG TPA: hypothetical protein PLU11_03195 [Chitinophagaceae bacterium]|nr:hypothetical protein [Chitinophagaceae bacterium]HPH30232.1 hypothetical protein [Chitinophagaceae bacterium]HPN58146.1 hypothetical protein [Chitinophagaceae bacterium]